MGDAAGVFIAGYVLLFSTDSNTVPKRFLITGKMTAGCLRLILIKGFSLLRKIDFSVVMLLKMSARLIMTER
jgi:hypothetical protein